MKHLNRFNESSFNIVDSNGNQIKIGDRVKTIFNEQVARKEGFDLKIWTENGGSEEFTIERIDGPVEFNSRKGNGPIRNDVFKLCGKGGGYFYNIEVEKIS